MTKQREKSREEVTAQIENGNKKIQQLNNSPCTAPNVSM